MTLPTTKNADKSADRRYWFTVTTSGFALMAGLVLALAVEPGLARVSGAVLALLGTVGVFVGAYYPWYEPKDALFYCERCEGNYHRFLRVRLRHFWFCTVRGELSDDGVPLSRVVGTGILVGITVGVVAAIVWFMWVGIADDLGAIF